MTVGLSNGMISFCLDSRRAGGKTLKNNTKELSKQSHGSFLEQSGRPGVFGKEEYPPWIRP
jgi:hypothetical protein